MAVDRKELCAPGANFDAEEGAREQTTVEVKLSWHKQYALCGTILIAFFASVILCLLTLVRIPDYAKAGGHGHRLGKAFIGQTLPIRWPLHLPISGKPSARFPRTPSHHSAAMSRTGRAEMRFVAPPDDSDYDTLGVKRSASLDEVKKQFRKRARDLHPDTNPAPDAAEQFRRMVNAFEKIVLSKTKKGPDESNGVDTGPDESNGVDTEEAWGADASSASQGPPRNQQAAADAYREGVADVDPVVYEDIILARERWTLLSRILVDHMPVGHVASIEEKRDFAQVLEDTVCAFASQAAAEPHNANFDDLGSEGAFLKNCFNRQMLLAEQKDLQLRRKLFRQRIESLEKQVEQAEHDAEFWRGTMSVSEADQTFAMQLELDALELANTLRDRLTAQRHEAERCEHLERIVFNRLNGELHDART